MLANCVLRCKLLRGGVASGFLHHVCDECMRAQVEFCCVSFQTVSLYQALCITFCASCFVHYALCFVLCALCIAHAGRSYTAL